MTKKKTESTAQSLSSGVINNFKKGDCLSKSAEVCGVVMTIPCRERHEESIWMPGNVLR